MPATLQHPSQSSSYDAAGNIRYDGDGRICAVASAPIPGVTTMTGYIYDADGRRVAKGTITTWSCNPAVSGFQTTNDYSIGQSGEQITETGIDANNTRAWQHTNVYAAGKLIATYDLDGLHFYLNDPLGTRRAQTDYAGVLEQTCSGLLFGDGLNCSGGNLQAPTEHHFTGKERDTESGNDYFGARYYSSSMGRFMSPDWSAKEEPVPYAKLDDPQTLNLYAYVGNNPLARDEPDGHAFGLDDLVGATAGALVGMATEAIKDVATGQHITAGAMAGAAFGGAIFAEGIVNMPETLGGSVVAAAAVKGAAQGFVSNAVQQGVDNMTGDQKGFSIKSSAVSTALGAATGGLASKMPEVKVPGITSGTGNMRSVAKGVATKIANGTASRMSLKTALKGAVGGQVANTGKTVAQTYGTAVTTSVCNANTGGACK